MKPIEQKLPTSLDYKQAGINPYIFVILDEKKFQLCPPDIRKAHKIRKIVADYYDVGVWQLDHKTRKREIVIARHTAQQLIKTHTNLSLKHTGGLFGGRDHSTVISAMYAVQNLIDTDKGFAQQYNEILEKLENECIIIRKLQQK